MHLPACWHGRLSRAAVQQLRVCRGSAARRCCCAAAAAAPRLPVKRSPAAAAFAMAEQAPPPTSAVLMSLSKHIAVRCAKVRTALDSATGSSPLHASACNISLRCCAQHRMRLCRQKPGSVVNPAVCMFDRRSTVSTWPARTRMPTPRHAWRRATPSPAASSTCEEKARLDSHTPDREPPSVLGQRRRCLCDRKQSKQAWHHNCRARCMLPVQQLLAQLLVSTQDFPAFPWRALSAAGSRR